MAQKVRSRLRGATSRAGQQLPFWGDWAGWDQPQYYETLQAGRRRNGGRSNLFGSENGDALLTRGPGGLLTNSYDSVTGQWIQVPGAPVLSDASGWADPSYYSTIMTADIDGDGIAELLARAAAGIMVWKYDSSSQTWSQLAALPDLSDANGWNQVQYYSTIQCADIDGDNAFELLGRGEYGLNVWKYDPSSRNWSQLATLPDLSDANGWNQVQYYSTIQSAATGLGPTHGQAPGQTIMARASTGLEVWKYNPTQNQPWQQIPFTPLLTDADGWDQPEYYSTIQFVDIDGNGVVEMVARGPQGLQAWTFQQNKDASYSWVALPSGPDWSDTNGWNQVQYYSTIQPAYLYSQGVILARNSGFVETWRYDVAAQAWYQRSNAAFPPFTGDQLKAYNYLTTWWNILGTDGGGVRYLYNDEAADFSSWRDSLANGSIPAPPNVSKDDWAAITTQISHELTWVINVQKWYGTGGLVGTQITNTFLGEEITLYTVGYNYFQFSSDSTATLALSILALIAGALAAALGFPELEAGVAASIVGVIGYAFAAAQETLPAQGGSFQAQYNQLQAQLDDGFNTALTQLGQNLSGITGGNAGSGYVPGDYGLLSAIGQMIETGVWNWPAASAGLVVQMQRGYAIEVWKVLFNTYQVIAGNNTWGVGINTYNTSEVPYEYPTTYAIWYGPVQIEEDEYTCNHWIYVGSLTGNTYPPAGTLIAQFNPPVEGKVFPLGIPAAEVIQGQNGWPIMNSANIASPLPPVKSPHKLPALGVDLNTAFRLKRGANGEISVTAEITNRGLTGASNVEITDAQLNLGNPPSWFPVKRTYLAPGRRMLAEVALPNLPKGADAVLCIFGRYLDGTLGATLRAKLP